jgi:hypothetical protein
MLPTQAMSWIFTRVVVLAAMLGLALAAAAETPQVTPAGAAALPQAGFLSVEAQSMAGDTFAFPDDMRGEPLIIIGLAISTSQANGEFQQNLLLDWHRWLTTQAELPEGVRIYHFPVLENPPRFIRGVIRRAMRKLFDGTVPLSQAAVLYVQDSAAFAAAAGIEVDDNPTLVIADAQRRPLRWFKGGPDQENTAAFRAAMLQLSADEAHP